MAGMWFTNNTPEKVDPKSQFAPKAGTRYNPPPAEDAANRVEAWPESNSPGPPGHSNEITSAQPAQRGPFQKTSDAPTDEWLKPWPSSKSNGNGRFFK